jgi:predicted MPP superfamily phosphohydrolase
VIHLIEPVVAGLAQFGRTQIYVNSGTGYWGPPMRVGTESEITLITLRAATA